MQYNDFKFNISHKGCDIIPKIFSEQEKEIIKQKLLAIGLEQLEKKGYKNCRVEEIAKAGGIAKGTFYNFFASKELFFYEIIISVRDKNRQEIYELFAGNSKPDKKILTEYFIKRYTINKTVYHYFSVEDLNVIFRKLPDAADSSAAESNDFAAEVFSHMRKESSDYKLGVIVSMMNVMGAYSANRDMLSNNYYTDTVQLLAKALTDYIFGK